MLTMLESNGYDVKRVTLKMLESNGYDVKRVTEGQARTGAQLTTGLGCHK
jgi:hypothetical protein